MRRLRHQAFNPFKTSEKKMILISSLSKLFLINYILPGKILKILILISSLSKLFLKTIFFCWFLLNNKVGGDGGDQPRGSFPISPPSMAEGPSRGRRGSTLF